VGRPGRRSVVQQHVDLDQLHGRTVRSSSTAR
jgi:hypothetical protein